MSQYCSICRLQVMHANVTSHMMSHDRLMCAICKIYIPIKDMILHLKCHGNRSIKCRLNSVCQIMFTTNEAMFEHMEREHRMPHCCKLCDDICISRRQLIDHMDTIHGNTIHCTHCDNRFVNDAHFTHHIYEACKRLGMTPLN